MYDSDGSTVNCVYVAGRVLCMIIVHSCMLHSRCSQSANPSTTSQSNTLQDTPRTRTLTFVTEKITHLKIFNNTQNTGINASLIMSTLMLQCLFLLWNALTLSVCTEYIYSVASQATSPAPFNPSAWSDGRCPHRKNTICRGVTGNTRNKQPDYNCSLWCRDMYEWMRACMWRAVPVTPRQMVFLLCGHRPSLHAEGLIHWWVVSEKVMIGIHLFGKHGPYDFSSRYCTSDSIFCIICEVDFVSWTEIPWRIYL
jgi:hypothetical protein